MPAGRVLADLSDIGIVLGEPDIVSAVNSDAVGLAVARRGRNLFELMCRRIELADLIRIMLGEPDIAIAIDGDIPRTRGGSWHCPLTDLTAGRHEFANRVAHWHSEPDIAALIKSQE